MSKYPQRKNGLILLVVLSMLTLFSLLSITYVVFSSQSRTSSMGMARRDHHRMQQDRLLDYSLQQVLRGPKPGGRSAIGPNSLLADVYGYNRSLPTTNLLFQARFTTASDQAEFFASRFLRIPLLTTGAGTPPTAVPPDDQDVLTGRVLTFVEGPLRNYSFRIVRSFGLAPTVNDHRYSVIIDLMEASKTKSNSLSAWISSGATTLCQSTTASAGYRIRINDRETNGFGIGIRADGIVEEYPPTLPPPATPPSYPLPIGFLPNYQATAASMTGDTDESYDAADYNDPWLAHRRSGATVSEDVLPSFHRAALINYIVNKEDLTNTTTFTQPEFLAMLDQIQRACSRPVGISVINLEMAPNYISDNREFTGSNLGTFPGQTPTLDINLRGQWTNWTVAAAAGLPTPLESFQNFVRFLTKGPWDVDNDGDGLPDSVWVDGDLPLMTSPEGKLLKMLTAYLIVDLDSKLDLNAVGNLHQTTAATYVPTTTNAFTTAGVSLPQGFGPGPADSSLRHLFASDTDYVNFLEARYGGTNGTPGEGLSTSVATLVDDVRSRLDGGGLVFNPVTATAQNTGTRERRQIVRHDQLPGLPIGIRGAEALGFDRLGNPLLTRGTSATIADQGVDDPYEFRLLETSHRDLPFTIADWERIYRKYDWDVSMLPRRLKAFPSLETNVNAVTPRSAHLRNVPLAARVATGTSNPVSSLYDLIVRIGQNRTPAIGGLTSAMFQELFPFEFGRGMALDLNRPFGNGIDDDLDGQIDEPEELLKNRIDDNANGTIDEPAELAITHRQGSVYATTARAQVTSAGEYPTYTTVRMDPLYEGFVTTAPTTTAVYHHGQQSRQLLARNLYCLGMLLLPDDLYLSNRPGVALTLDDRARAIAQWAVNVVDFRDADHAMTRFPYDPHPFQVRGTDTLGQFWVPNLDDGGSPNGEVVWGMEQPELLLTETLATHDPRVKDTSDDGTGQNTTAPLPNRDNDFDQYRIPEGSLFLEFFCPRTTSTLTDSTVPGTGSALYTGATNTALNLSALSPSDGTTVYPVWRVAITEPHPGSPTSAEAMRAAGTSTSLTYQIPLSPANANLSGLRYDTTGTTPAPVIDRILWFTNPANVGTTANIADAAVGLSTAVPPTDRPARVFGDVDATNALSIRGGQYLVVGPRQITYFGSQENSGPTHTNLPNNHRLVLENTTTTSGSLPAPAASWVNVYTGDNTIVAKRPATMRDSVSMVAVTPAPWPSGGTTRLSPTVGISVSEPVANLSTYYPAPTQLVNNSNTTAAPNGAPGFGAAGTFKDGYHDYSATPPPAPGNTPLSDLPFDARPAPPIPPIPTVPPVPTTHPIQQHYLPTHAPIGSSGVAAPGTQLDWCTAYLQRLADPERPWHAALNPYITVDWMPIDLTVFSGEETITGGSFQFASRQKNGQIGSVRGSTFLSYSNDPPAPTTAIAGSTSYFKHELDIDNAIGTIATLPQVARPTATAADNFATFGYLNSSYRLLNEPAVVVPGLPGIYLGAPASPNPAIPGLAPRNLTWFNRPFASPYELMLVPLCAPGQLMQEFSPPAMHTDVAAIDQYADPTLGNVFTHLPNFFQARPASTQYSASALFELVTTPSPWSDADSIVPPADFTPTNTREFAAIGSLLPPYNRVSKMIERGRINVNTVSEEAAWQGAEWNYMNTANRASVGSTSYWTPLTQARRIYTFPTPVGQIPSGNPRLHPDYPTEFPGVFKSQFSYGLVPTTRSSTLDAGMPISATLFRKSGTGNSPVLNVRSDLSSGQAQAFNEYLPITRLANLTTNRSNVFAIYMTIGYFEYDPSTGITQEYGWDNGKTRRHRGFYVVDRSIPVAFEPGVDNNTENCILTRRIIE